jgi:hypothetical protein
MSHKLSEFFTDPSSGELSASRFCLTVVNLAGIMIAAKLTAMGQGGYAAAIITGLATTDAGVYAVSTYKKRGCENGREGEIGGPGGPT